MVEHGKGSIIVFSSIRAQVVEPGQSVYAAPKAGTLQMIRALAASSANRAFAPMPSRPALSRRSLTQQIKQNDAWYRAYSDKSVMRRWAKPSELVGAVVYLASDASSYVTGSYLLIDGGWICGAKANRAPELLARRLRLLKIALCHASSLKDQVGKHADVGSHD
jgi:NAD(P)-dependent dehydrogenase (short-subunit alcohol dehydrogenase family)